MPVRLTTTITNISSVPDPTNRGLLNEFHQYMKSIGTSDSYQNGNLKIMTYFAKWLGPDISIYDIRKKDQILAFLNTRIKDIENYCS
jgi:integrase/recombinase XerD